jgi:hypothetical protein
MAGIYDRPLGAPERSGAVTAVAVVNFVAGGLALMCGLLMLFTGAVLTSAGSNPEIQERIERELRRKGSTMTADEAGKAAATVGALALILAVVILLWGAGAIAGGLGLLQRRKWARLLTCGLGGVAATLALLSLYQTFAEGAINIIAVLFFAAYAVTVFILLLKPDVVNELST